MLFTALLHFSAPCLSSLFRSYSFSLTLAPSHSFSSPATSPGESEAQLRGVFDAASAAAPSVVFLDELDAIAPSRSGVGGGGGGGGGSAMASRLLTTLLTILDGQGDEMKGIVVIAATNR